jgi:hypothetical protein
MLDTRLAGVRVASDKRFRVVAEQTEEENNPYKRC